MFVVLFNFRKKKKRSASSNWFFAPIPTLSRASGIIWQTIHLVSISAQVDYNWQTINNIAVIVVIIIII